MKQGATLMRRAIVGSVGRWVRRSTWRPSDRRQRPPITPGNAHSLAPLAMLRPRGLWDDGPTCFAFSPTSDLVAAGRANKTASIWDLATGRAVMQLRGRRIFQENSFATNVISGTEPPAVRHVAFAGGQTLIMQVEARTVAVWDLATGRERYTLRGRHEEEGDEPDVYVDTGEDRQAARHRPAVEVAAAPSPTGDVLLVSASRRSGSGTRIQLRETRSGRLLHESDQRDSTGRSRGILVPPQRAVFSPDGTHVAVPVGSYAERAVEVRRTDRWSEARRVDWAWPVVFSADGSVVAGADVAGVRLWEVATGLERWRSIEDLTYARNVALAPSGEVVVAETNRADGSLGAVRCWETATGRAWELASGEEGPVVDIAFSPDGRLLAVARYWSLEVWEPGTSRLLYRYSRRARDQHFVRAGGKVGFSPDGTVVALDAHAGIALWVSYR